MRRSKYGAVRTTVEGITFASKKEARRYQELRLLEKAGEIWGLACQPRYSLEVNGRKIGEYRGDFVYGIGPMDGACRAVCEDVKGFKTPLYRWKKRHVEAQYGIDIREI